MCCRPRPCALTLHKHAPNALTTNTRFYVIRCSHSTHCYTIQQRLALTHSRTARPPLQRRARAREIDKNSPLACSQHIHPIHVCAARMHTRVLIVNTNCRRRMRSSGSQQRVVLRECTDFTSRRLNKSMHRRRRRCRRRTPARLGRLPPSCAFLTALALSLFSSVGAYVTVLCQRTYRGSRARARARRASSRHDLCSSCECLFAMLRRALIIRQCIVRLRVL